LMGILVEDEGQFLGVNFALAVGKQEGLEHGNGRLNYFGCKKFDIRKGGREEERKS